MNTFNLNIEQWVEGAAPPELATTCGNLSIVINDQNVTRLDKLSGTVNSVCVSLYPLAEWIAGNWWRLLYECNPHRDTEDYQACHNFSYAGEGYFLPDLLFVPEIDVVKFRWQPRSINHKTLQFINGGTASISFPEVQKELIRFVDCIVERLDDNRIKHSPLQRDWAAVAASANNIEERDFCIACAQLGFDPYHLPGLLADLIVETYELLNQKTDMAEFFNSVTPEHLDETASWVKDISESVRAPKGNIALLQDIKEHKPAFGAMPPWALGYEEAKWVRSCFFPHQDDLRQLNGLIAENTISTSIPHGFCSALTNNSKKNTPTFAQPATNSNKFLQGRMLAEYLDLGVDNFGLITRVSTPNQKRYRAFSAELIVPADSLKADLKGKQQVCEDDIVELAEKYDASEFVVKHQIENHHLAVVV